MTTKRRRSASGIGGLDAVPPSAPSSHVTEDQQTSLPASNVASEQASLPAQDGPASDGAPPPPAVDPAPPAPAPASADPMQPQWGVAELIGGIDPEKDRYQSGIRLPKYVMEALRLQATLTRQEQQDIAAAGVKAVLPAELLDATYQRLYGRQRPPI